MITAQQYQQRWAAGMNNAAEKIRQGVLATQKNPMERAAAAVTKMKLRFIQAIESGRYQQGLANVTLDQWKKAMVNKGVGRIPDGVAGAAPKVTNFAQQLLAHEAQLMTQIEQMPKITPADSKARMNAWFDGMQTFRYNRG